MAAVVILDNLESGETLTLQLLTPGADAAPVGTASLTAGDTRTHRYSASIDPSALSIADGTQLEVRVVDNDSDLYCRGWVTIVDGQDCHVVSRSHVTSVAVGVVSSIQSGLGTAAGTVTGFSNSALTQLISQEIRVGVVTKLGGKLTQPIIKGSAYTSGLGTAIEIPIAAPDLSASDAVTLHLVKQDDDAVTYSVAGSVATIAEALHARFELSSATTGAWVVGDYWWTVTIDFSSETVELPHGELTVSRSYSS